MEHGSLQNNKRRWTRTRYQPMRNPRKIGGSDTLPI